MTSILLNNLVYFYKQKNRAKNTLCAYNTYVYKNMFKIFLFYNISIAIAIKILYFNIYYSVDFININYLLSQIIILITPILNKELPYVKFNKRDQCFPTIRWHFFDKIIDIK